MSRSPKSAAIEKIETTDLFALGYVVPEDTVSTAFMVLTNTTDNILDVSVYINDGVEDFLLVRDKIPGQPGLFFAVHSIATDSEGNIYTTETYEGKRVQKFVYQGMGPVTEMDQGAPWPRGSQ